MSETKQRWGRRWARPPPRGLPRTTAQRPFEDVSVGFFSLLCVCGCVRSRVCSLCIVYLKTVCSRFRPAKRRAQNLQGTRFLYAYFCFCYLGGGSLDGGDHVSPRCLGPSRSTPEGCGAAHGPRHPAYPLLLRPVMSSWGFRFHFSWLLGSAWVFALKQRFFVRFFLPFKTRPLLECLFGSLSLSLSFSCCLVVFLSAVVACLSFSPLQALGKHKPRCGLWFPLCSFLAVLFFLDPYSRYRNYTKAWLPHLFFCRFLGLFSLSAFRSLSLSLSLFLSLSLSGVGRPGCACRCDRIHGGGLQDGAPNYSHDCFLGFFLGEEQPYCHTDAFARYRAGTVTFFSWLFPTDEGGNAVRFSLLFFLRSGSCPLPFFGKVLFF